MVYMGSKNRISKDLLPIITKYLTKDRWYVEPFCGGCNMIDKVKHDKRIANDYNKYLIALFKALQDGIELPNQITKEMFAEARDNFHGKKETMTLYLIGWIGFMAGFSGRFFDGGYAGHDFKGRDYVKERINNLMKQFPLIKDCVFKSGSYNGLDIPYNSVVYCDPPYFGTKEYKVSIDFNHDEFWQWCRDMTEKGNDVLISEYNAPSDFVCVWHKQVTNAMNTKNTYKPTEKLFVNESIADKYKQQQVEQLRMF